MNLEPAQIRHIHGFGRQLGADAYVFTPETPEEILELYECARTTGRSVSFAGSQRSYGDPMMTPEGIVISLRNFNKIGQIEEGFIQVGGGVSLETLWRTVAPQGFWPKVVSGTAKTTVAGATAMNIHGKNAFKVGNFGESIRALDLVSPIGPADEGVGSMGLWGAIISVTLALQPIQTASVSVIAHTPRTWEEHLLLFEELKADSDYMVGWIDLFSRDGRGLFHAAKYAQIGMPVGARQLQENPLFGVIPRDQAWRVLRQLNRPRLAQLLNSAKFRSAQFLNRAKPRLQSLAEFNFLLDALPHWERAYTEGLRQFQVFLPSDTALEALKQLQMIQKGRGIVSTLGVLKAHRTSAQVLPYSLDGYSLAMDFAEQPGLPMLFNEMSKVSLDAGGRFYLAKDSTLTSEQYQSALPPGVINEFRTLKSKYDPDNLLQSLQSRRLGLT